MLVEKSLDQMFSEIKCSSFVRYDVIIPEEIEGCPKGWNPPFTFDRSPSAKEELPPFSDLWSQFVSDYYHGLDEIVDHINERLGRYGPKRTGRGLIAFALENAFLHGNKNDPNLAVSVKLFEGEQGVVIRIRDAGEGFNFKEISRRVSLVLKQHPHESLDSIRHPLPKMQRYYRRSGGGFFMYAGHPAEVSFENEGTTINIMYSFKNRFFRPA